MIKRTRVEIDKCIIHKVGNKYNGGRNVFSEEIVRFDERSYELLLPFLLKPFEKETQSYRFTHERDIEFNTLRRLVVDNSLDFVQMSKDITQHLYNQSNSAQIKRGDLLVCSFRNVEYKDNLVDATGIFKIENKADFFQTFEEGSSYDIMVTKGISTSKLDKGCLILNTKDTEGTIVLSVDNNSYDAQYWINDFLDVKLADNKNKHTLEFLTFCKEFSDDVLEVNYGKKKASEFLNSIVDYTKEHEIVRYNDVIEDVIEDSDVITVMNDYKKTFQDAFGTVLMNNIEVADEVVKKEKRKLKTVLKLDTGFKIEIDIDSPDAPIEYLEEGYDEGKKMRYYKVYYNQEK